MSFVWSEKQKVIPAKESATKRGLNNNKTTAGPRSSEDKYFYMRSILEKHGTVFTASLHHSATARNFSPSYLADIKKHAGFIHDINITSRVFPFERDAHGVFMAPDAAEKHMADALWLQEQTGINVSFLFNNIYVPPTKENLKTFIKNFAPWYEKGVRNITVPHLLWMHFGDLRKAFPDLFIKDTVLRGVRTAQEFWAHAEAGFDYINVERRLMRDIPALAEIRRARDKYYENYGRYKYLSIVVNDGCYGDCPFLFAEHYQHTMQHPDLEDKNNEVFDVPRHLFCIPRRASRLKSCQLSFFAADIEEVLENIDVLKLGGRRHGGGAPKVLASLNMIKNILSQNIDDGVVPMFAPKGFPRLNTITGQKDKALIDVWRKKIRTCRFECWDCELCEEMDYRFLK